jgi:uncharacterized protein YcbK (DUF882 family)
MPAMPSTSRAVPGLPPGAAVSRRETVRAALLALLGAALGPRAALAAVAGSSRLRMVHAHTGEKLDIVYREGGVLVSDALPVVDHFLRDFRTGRTIAMDIGTLDIAWAITQACGKGGGGGNDGCELEIVSGYRTAQTNALLRSEGRGVAAYSLHMVGQAIDLRMPGFKTAALRDAALALGRGGVGYYATSDFVHVDTGPVRRW